jgi:NO-binding membrane sensor protein with MHYT domain
VTIPHDPWLVALSIAIAIQGSFVGLSLARGIDSAEVFRRRLALAGSAITLATGVWSMHFVAMLAANFPSAVDYLVLPTLISFLICVIVVGIGAYAAHMPGSPAFRIGTGALAMGLGVSLMH